MGEEFTAATQVAFKGVITKPPLTEKLLSKPPFRFLHDVLSAVEKNTGFFEGLYAGDQKDPKDMEKDEKVAYLTKAIDAVSFALGEVIDVNPTKIVAGREPEKTNAFLQKVAQAAKSPDASKSAVERVLAGEKPSSLNDSGGSAGSNKENRSSEKKTRTSSKEKKDKSSSKTRDKEKRESSKDKKRSSSKDKERRSKTSSSKSGGKESARSPKKSARDEASPRRRAGSAKTEESGDTPATEGNSLIVNGHGGPSREGSEEGERMLFAGRRQKSSGSDRSSAGTRKGSAAPRPPSGRVQQSIDHDEDEEPAPRPVSRMTRSARPGTAAARPGTSLGARPGTAARAAPPRLKRRELGEIEQPQRVDSASSQKETTNIITGGGDGKTEEEDAFIMEETSPRLDPGALSPDDAVDADELDAAEHGGLVRDILATKNQLERGLGSAESGEGGRGGRGVRVEIDEKEREKTRKEAAKLQETVQSLTRTSHPLGRLVDYQQEDVDSMLKELESWRDEYKKNLTQLHRLRGSEGQSLEPLRGKLAELDQQIREKRDAISAVRGSILDAEEKLRNLVQAVGR